MVLSGIVLFLATCTDLYGRKHATTKYGMLYTAKGVAALLVPLANALYDATGKNWSAVFIVAAVFNIVAALMAVFVRRRAMALA